MFRLVEPLPDIEERRLSSLRNMLSSLNKVCIAFSGGVDSSLVAAIAFEQLGQAAIAVTGVSASLAPRLLEEARQQALWLGIEHREKKTHELKDPIYTSNTRDRCYACKKELHLKLRDIFINDSNMNYIDGVNFDDINDYRPGIKAAHEAGVKSPLAELQIGKKSVRTISKALGFPWWDKPSQPCLSSRFPYGEEITSKRLKQVSLAEEWMHQNGFDAVRVRSQGLSARIELPRDQIHEFVLKIDHQEIVDYYLSIGFTSVSLDLEGLISGKLNRLGQGTKRN